MNNKQGTVAFSRILNSIKDELEESNPKFTKALNDALNNDGTLAVKAKFGQVVDIQFLPENKEDKTNPQ
jgi:hypothetical protein